MTNQWPRSIFSGNLATMAVIILENNRGNSIKCIFGFLSMSVSDLHHRPSILTI